MEMVSLSLIIVVQSLKELFQMDIVMVVALLHILMGVNIRVSGIIIILGGVGLIQKMTVQYSRVFGKDGKLLKKTNHLENLLI